MLIDSFESIDGWQTGRNGETTFQISKKHVVEGEYSLNFSVFINHGKSNGARADEKPLSWPNIKKKYNKPISLEAYDFLEFDIYFESSIGIDPDDAINVILKDSNGRTIYRNLLINLKHGKWTHQKLSIRKLPFCNDVRQLNFFLSEDRYSHDETLNFFIDNLKATKATNYKPAKAKTSAALILDTDSFILWSEGSCRKIMRTEIPELKKKKNFIEIFAARNETEAVQLVLLPREKQKFKNVYLKIGEFIGPNGAEIGTENFFWSPVVYVPAKEGPPEGLPDGLPGPEPFDLKRKWNYPIWLEVYVPSGMPAGDYKAPITLYMGKKTYQVEFRLHVWNFDIPIQQSLRTNTTIYRSATWSKEISGWFGDMSHKQYLKQFRPHIAALLAKYRLSPNITSFLPIKYSEKRGKVVLENTKKFEEEVQANLSRGQHINQMGVPYFFDRPEFLKARKGTSEYLERIGDAYKIAADFLERKGWLEGTYVYCVDEVISHKVKYADELELLNKVFDTIRNSHPQIKLFGAETPSSAIRDLDTWCINIKSFDIGVLKEQKDLGKSVWWYNGYQLPKPGMAIAHRAVNHRVLFWMNYKYGIDGYLFWATNRWVRNPWVHPNRNDKRKNRAGSHYLLYPNPNGTVSPSLRLSIMRDGLEDYEYHHLLLKISKKLKKNGNVTLAADCEEIIKKADSFIMSYDNCSYMNPNDIYENRRLLAEQIEKTIFYAK